MNLFKHYIFILIIFIAGCKEHILVDRIITPPAYPILSANIEVFEPDLFENSYVMAIENGSKKSYLLDKTGHKVYEWNFDTDLGNDLELLPDGRLLGLFKISEPNFSFGGYAGILRILNIDGSVDWEYAYASSDYISHHDVEMMPNGNVLFLAWEKIEVEKANEAGVNTERIIYPESLIEVDPETNDIVWEWHSFDHIIQDIFPESSSYGIINENPQLININYGGASNNGDVMHANGIDYDAQNDIIYISVNRYSEVWVIDHSTTISLAKTNKGGKYNKGGDLLYRFGNPETYNNSFGERLFYKNHFPNLLENDVPGVGNFLIYNNGIEIEQSTVYELKIPAPLELKVDANNEPEIIWSFSDTTLFNPNISGAVRLKNGNTLICEGGYGFWEVTKEGEIAWKYNGGVDVSFWRCYDFDLYSSAIINLGIE
jgi:hypothetical protein